MKRFFYTCTLLLWGIVTITICLLMYPVYLMACVWSQLTNANKSK